MVDPVHGKSYKFEFPGNYNVEEMDLIDIRRKIMKWCAKSQGAIGPCRECKSKCSAGIKAIELYDGIDAPKASEPEVKKNVPQVANDEKEKRENKKEMKNAGNKKSGRPVSKWYEDAMASGEPEKWCVDNLHITIQQAKKRIYMYEYNRFGVRRTKQAVAKVSPGPVIKTQEADFSLIDAMQTEMQALTKKQKEYKAQIDDLTDKHKKISDRIEAITMCIELYKEKVTL